MKPIVDQNIRDCYVTAQNFKWDNATISKKSVFFTNNFAPIVIDSGASYCLSHVRYDFITPITKALIQALQTLDSNVAVEGIGRVC